MSLVKEQNKFLQDVALLIQEADRLGFIITGGELYRTEDQQQLYMNGETIEVIDEELQLVKTKPKSRTMKSNHLRRLAIDFNFFIDGQLTWDKEDIKPLGAFWESLDTKNRWGGNFKSIVDVPHFERNV